MNLSEVVTQAAVVLGSGLFQPEWYLSNNPDVEASGVNPCLHFMLTGWTEGRRPSPFFDTASYLNEYPDVRESKVNPLWHYLTVGWLEGRTAGVSNEDLTTKMAQDSLALQVPLALLIKAVEFAEMRREERSQGSQELDVTVQIWATTGVDHE